MESDGHTNAEVDAFVLKIRGELASFNAQLSYLNLLRRKALNDYLDLKGNIRVFCRVRPILPDESGRHLKSVITADSSNLFVKIDENKSKQYNFDKVFHPQSTQDEVFSEIVPVIKSALDGYNVCIFAYGQTSSGKTYTMEGKPDCLGVVSRGMEALFQQAQESRSKFLFTFSMLEIYMGNLRDLLVPQCKKPRAPKAPSLSIQMDRDGGIKIEHLLAVRVSELGQANRLYKLGSRSRSTASTLSNSTSSRSHCLIRISMTCLDAPERRRETNKIWMVDLGGSERMLKTQAKGKRLEEGKAINLSLSALGDVISALQTKRQHVPYRNSKLTQVLSDSLGSDSKTLMLAHVSPKEEDIPETLCSLEFASRVKSIHLGIEEPTELRVKTEVVMADLLQNMKHFESERQEVKIQIDRLHGRLKEIAMPETLSKGHSEVSVLSTEDPQSNRTGHMKSSIIDTVTSASLPRFMRSTICSKNKTANENQTFSSKGKKQPVHPKKTNSTSVYADSVIASTKVGAWQSDQGSEYSMSTISCANWKESTYDEIESSQVVLEYETKTVILMEQEKYPISLMTSCDKNGDINENSLVDETEQNKQNTKSWLHLQTAAQTNTNIHWGKRVLAVPMDGACNKCSEQNCENLICREERERDQFVSTRNPGIASKECKKYSTLEELSLNRTAREPMIVEKSHMNKAADGMDSFLINLSLHMTESEPDQNTFSDQTSQQIKILAEQHEELSKTTKAVEVGVDLSTTEKEISVSHDNTISDKSYTEEFCRSQQHKGEVEKIGLCSMSCRWSLFMEKDLTKLNQKSEAVGEPIVPVNNVQEEKDNLAMSYNRHCVTLGFSSGTCQFLRQVVQLLRACGLLGLGIHSLGFSSDFYYGLTL